MFIIFTAEEFVMRKLQEFDAARCLGSEAAIS
jgi:hypothetical protein